ncbi:MAG: hypothetical protein AAF704_15985, partial [Cyanobacteria bacterium P01_D01_bin.123]
MKGYLYVVTGDRFIDEALNSAKSLRSVQKDANISIVTDKEVSNNDHLFNKVIIKPSQLQNCKEQSYMKKRKEGLLYKVRHIYESSPYRETVFLDSDTYICERCDDLFEVLDFFDLALAHDPNDTARPAHIKTAKVLDSIDVFNTGLIVFSKSESNKMLFS